MVFFLFYSKFLDDNISHDAKEKGNVNLKSISKR